jgi:bacteriocin-like protein
MLGMEKYFAKVDQELNSSALAILNSSALTRENVSPEGGRELTDEELEQVTGGCPLVCHIFDFLCKPPCGTA